MYGEKKDVVIFLALCIVVILGAWKAAELFFQFVHWVGL